MLIRCDNCGEPVDKGDAIVDASSEDDVYYFCSQRCYEASEADPVEDAEPQAE